MKLLTYAACLIAPSLADAKASASPLPILDLSKDFVESLSINQSPSALAIDDVLHASPNVRTFMVIDGGEIVVSYARDDVDPGEPYEVFSVTKSVTSLLIGILIDENATSVDETLGEIFTNETIWEGVDDADYRKNITIREMLTMTSGMRFSWSDIATPEWISGYCTSNQVGDLLRLSLGDPSIGTKGQFEYLIVNDILGYTILERTGLTPREFLATKVLPYIGIEDDEIDWTADFEAVCPNYTLTPGTPEPAFTGLYLTAVQMAKIGMLYLQGGAAGPDTMVVSSGWVNETFTSHVLIGETLAYDTPNPASGMPYGYLWYNMSNYWSAVGYGGQVIGVDPMMGRVCVHQREYNVSGGEIETFSIMRMALDPNISFEIPVNDTVPNATAAASSSPTSSPSVDSAVVSSGIVVRLAVPLVSTVMAVVFLL